ncbi:proprotein convertase P-domain-containing protein [Nocardiopsis sediminis]|uniref:Proprotein convertase P-domain-containing protein n=1 Tax=Nocardiopsis sediminis TaxID=1778267 RepID=A0ABV8FG22_9ACTN
MAGGSPFDPPPEPYQPGQPGPYGQYPPPGQPGPGPADWQGQPGFGPPTGGQAPIPPGGGFPGQPGGPLPPGPGYPPGYPGGPPQQGGSKGWIIAVIVGGVILVLVIAVLLFVFVFNRDGGSGGGGGTGTGAGGFENTSPLAIEDQSTVESTINVTGVDGNAPTSLGVNVDITHDYISDLDLELVAPDGTSFPLEAFEGSHRYTVDASAAAAAGTWTLRVSDGAPADTGTLNSWSLEFGSGGSGSTSSGAGSFESGSSVTIEDQSTVESAIEVSGVEGNAPSSLGVTVDISHSYISDLSLELVSPDGTSFPLEAFEGSHQYTVDASAATAAGTWTLRVEDSAAADTGTINSWSLNF